MTIFAGIYARRNDGSIPITFINELRSALSRHPDDEKSRIEFIDDKVYLAKIDIGALREPGHFKQGNMTAFVAGDPLLQFESELPGSRLASLQKITTNLINGQQDALRACRGTYCAVAYEHAQHKLYLMVDKLGVRPIYCWISPDYVVFSTALRILEAVSFCKRSLDLQGIAEIACFGYPLADRSPYENIITLQAGELTICESHLCSRERYWRWDNLPNSYLTEDVSDEKFSKHLYQVFLDSTKIRLREQKTVAAFLSGGLDSRAEVAALKVCGAEVFAANFRLPGSQDYVFSEMMARRMSLTNFSHIEFHPLIEGDPYGKTAVQEWLKSPKFLAQNPKRPSVVWTGDGGSVGLGHVYLNASIVQTCREADLKKATGLFMNYNGLGITPKLLKPDIAKLSVYLFGKGLEEEINSFKPRDAGRIFYLFFLLNDQRRHMFNHFENMDLARIEFEMPFFDAEFIASIAGHPIDTFLYHHFYLEWLKNFPLQLGVLEIPWQAYPNHIPCPLPQPQNTVTQWSDVPTVAETKERKAIIWNNAKILLRNPSFSKQYLNKSYVYFFGLLNSFSKMTRPYLLQLPSTLYRYWSKTN
ncbi:MAG TPA: hypothetical protein DEF07_07495 [Nitrosomonas sp.]|uniref:asparagine synthase (glutamine-hydrolyzing) n=1 Tax=Nitrosomonas mobilis TaxID=51642 RepID=A0A1G5SKA5_9PROT|nr:asparagine synthase-related protein [Nitrosomonas mobilis]SCZ86971.1 Asparagine synthase [Nitrosomonas mobilis]HBV21546.1 hypothetical protein [Nitrosomonas sp.]HNO75234.1 asparagine synthase-related protein [Nitrosomonas mobilis]